MKKRMFLTGLLALALLTPASPAKAQGWPTFDVAKLASLITNLIGRFQPIPQVLSRVSQVKTTMAQLKAVGKAAMAADLKSIGMKAAAGLQKDAFSGGRSSSPIEKAATGSNGAADSSKAIKSTLFSLDKNKELTMDDVSKINTARQEYRRKVADEVLSTSFYMATNAPKQSAERFQKATETMQNASTVQDSINANTMMIMAGNFERLNQIVIDLAKLKMKSVEQLDTFPTTGFIKPKPPKSEDLKMGDVTYTVKDEGGRSYQL